MTEPIKRRPRWLRFSLRTLLVVMTVLCVWLGIKVNAARRQKEALTAVLNAARQSYLIINISCVQNLSCSQLGSLHSPLGFGKPCLNL